MPGASEARIGSGGTSAGRRALAAQLQMPAPARPGAAGHTIINQFTSSRNKTTELFKARIEKRRIITKKIDAQIETMYSLGSKWNLSLGRTERGYGFVQLSDLSQNFSNFEKYIEKYAEVSELISERGYEYCKDSQDLCKPTKEEMEMSTTDRYQASLESGKLKKSAIEQNQSTPPQESSQKAQHIQLSKNIDAHINHFVSVQLLQVIPITVNKLKERHWILSNKLISEIEKHKIEKEITWENTEIAFEDTRKKADKYHKQIIEHINQVDSIMQNVVSPIFEAELNDKLHAVRSTANSVNFMMDACWLPVFASHLRGTQFSRECAFSIEKFQNATNNWHIAIVASVKIVGNNEEVLASAATNKKNYTLDIKQAIGEMRELINNANNFIDANKAKIPEDIKKRTAERIELMVNAIGRMEEDGLKCAMDADIIMMAWSAPNLNSTSPKDATHSDRVGNMQASMEKLMAEKGLQDPQARETPVKPSIPKSKINIASQPSATVTDAPTQSASTDLQALENKVKIVFPEYAKNVIEITKNKIAIKQKSIPHNAIGLYNEVKNTLGNLTDSFERIMQQIPPTEQSGKKLTEDFQKVKKDILSKLELMKVQVLVNAFASVPNQSRFRALKESPFATIKILPAAEGDQNIKLSSHENDYLTKYRVDFHAKSESGEPDGSVFNAWIHEHRKEPKQDGLIYASHFKFSTPRNPESRSSFFISQNN